MFDRRFTRGQTHGEHDGSVVKVRPARLEDAVAVAEIYNQGILSKAVTFETQPRTAADRLRLIQSATDRYPILVAEGDLGEILGWAALAEHSPHLSHRGIAECSVYVEQAHRGRGVGTELMTAMIGEARALGFWKLISRVFLANEAGRALCLSAGFREVGVLERHAQLENRWVDVLVVERLIPENQG